MTANEKPAFAEQGLSQKGSPLIGCLIMDLAHASVGPEIYCSHFVISLQNFLVLYQSVIEKKVT